MANPDEFLSIRINQQADDIRLDHPSNADWWDVRKGMVAIRDHLTDRIERAEECPANLLASPTENVFNPHTSPVAMTVYDDVHEDIPWSGTRHYANASIAKQSLMQTLGLTVPRLLVKGAQGFDGLHVFLDDKLIAVMLPIDPIITEPTPVWDVEAPWANKGKPLGR